MSHHHINSIAKFALGVAVAICLVLVIWLIGLLVGIDEQKLLNTIDSDQEVQEQEELDAQENDAIETEEEINVDEEQQEETVDDSEPEESVDPEDDVVDNSSSPATWITMDGMIGLSTTSGQSVLLGSNGEVIVAESGQVSPLQISKRLLQIGEFESQDQAYERVRDELLADATTTDTCRRTLIDGQSAECYFIVQNRVSKTAYFVQIDRYVIMVTAQGTSAPELLDSIDWYPSQAFKQEATIIVGQS